MNIIKKFASWILKDEMNQLNDYISKENELSIKQDLIDYWNNKYPKTNMYYKRIDKLGEQLIDVRLFCNPINFNLPTIKGDTDDDIALNSLKWIINNVKYVQDINQYKNNEYWAFGYETRNTLEGDCEDFAILTYDVIRHNGVPSWKLRISAGFVNEPNTDREVGHVYLTYFCEETNQWVLLDGTYYPNTLPINQRPDYKDEENYGDVWFSFNEEYAWTKGLNSDANSLLNQ